MNWIASLGTSDAALGGVIDIDLIEAALDLFDNSRIRDSFHVEHEQFALGASTDRAAFYFEVFVAKSLANQVEVGLRDLDKTVARPSNDVFGNRLRHIAADVVS